MYRGILVIRSYVSGLRYVLDWLLKVLAVDSSKCSQAVDGKLVILDVDGTLGLSLIPEEEALRKIFGLVCREANRGFGLRISEREVEQFYNQAKREHYEMYPFRPERHNKWLRLKLFLDKVQTCNGLRFAPNFLDELHRFYWDYFLSHAKPYPDTCRTLEELMRKSIVVIATNNEDKETEIKLKLFGLEAGKHYNYLFSSEQLGVCKPAPAFVERLVQRLEELGHSVSRKKVFVVGDDPGKDFAWAKSIGAITIRIRKDLYANKEPSSPDEKPDYTVDNISEILEII